MIQSARFLSEAMSCPATFLAAGLVPAVSYLVITIRTGSRRTDYLFAFFAI